MECVIPKNTAHAALLFARPPSSPEVLAGPCRGRFLEALTSSWGCRLCQFVLYVVSLHFHLVPFSRVSRSDLIDLTQYLMVDYPRIYRSPTKEIAVHYETDKSKHPCALPRGTACRVTTAEVVARSYSFSINWSRSQSAHTNMGSGCTRTNTEMCQVWAVECAWLESGQ